MKFYFLFDEKSGPAGGGNQFLKALKQQLEKTGHLTTQASEAEVVLFNSYPFGAERLFFKLWRLKYAHPELTIIYRVDGPISAYRETDQDIDRAIALANRIFSDGIVFQSVWSAKENEALFKLSAPATTVIHNAPNTCFFRTSDTRKPGSKDKVRLVGSSWSTHKNKGFALFSWLDERLDFARYEMTFIGNSPVGFKNIRRVPALSPQELATELRRHDIYIFTSQIESCSNALTEALACGLPALAPNTSSNPEVVGAGGILYENTDDLLMGIDTIAGNLDAYRDRIPTRDIASVAEQYLAFATQIRKRPSRRITLSSWLQFFRLQGIILKWKILNLRRHLLRK